MGETEKLWTDYTCIIQELELETITANEKISLYNKAINILDRLPISSDTLYNRADLTFKLAETSFNLENYDNARDFYYETISNFKLFDRQYPNSRELKQIDLCYHDLGILYEHVYENKDLAVENYQKSIDQIINSMSIFGKKDRDYFRIGARFKNIAKIQASNGELSEALKNVQASVQYLKMQEENNSVISIEDFLEQYNDLIEITEQKLKAFQDAKIVYQKYIDWAKKRQPKDSSMISDLANKLYQLAKLDSQKLSYQDSAITNYTEALDLFKKIKDENIQYQYNILNISYALADLHKDKKNYSLAANYYQDAIAWCRIFLDQHQKTHVKPFLAQYLKDLGDILRKNLNEEQKAKDIYREALDIYSTLGDTDIDYMYNQLNIVYNLAQIYLNEKSFTLAVDYYRDAVTSCRILIDQHKKTHVKPFLARYLKDLGGILRKNLNEEQKAKEMYREALDIYSTLSNIDIDDIYGQLNSAYNLARIYLNEKSYSLAANYYRDAIASCRILIDQHQKTHIKPFLAQYLKELGDILRNNLNKEQEAKDIYREALDIYSTLGNTDIDYIYGQLNSAYNLARIYLNEKNYALAANYYKETITWCKVLIEQHQKTHIKSFLGIYQRELGDIQKNNLFQYREAFHTYKASMSNLKNLNDHYDRLNYYYALIGVAAIENNQFKSFTDSKNNFQMALEIIKELDIEKPYIYQSMIASNMLNLGIVYHFGSKENELAKGYYDKGIEIYETLNPKEKYIYSLAKGYSNKGRLELHRLSKRKDADLSFKKAVEYFDLVISQNLYNADKNAGLLGESYLELGEIHLDLRNYKQSINNLVKSISYYKQVIQEDPSVSRSMAIAYNYLCYLCKLGNKIEMAIDLAKKAYTLAVLHKIDLSLNDILSTSMEVLNVNCPDFAVNLLNDIDLNLDIGFDPDLIASFDLDSFDFDFDFDISPSFDIDIDFG